MAPSDEQQRIQESRYEFPYHYIPRLEDGDFSQARVLDWGYEYLSYIRFVLAKLETLPFRSLLDVGCGDGRFLGEVRRQFPKKELVGIDFSEQAIRYAKVLCPDVEFCCEDFRTGLLRQRSFDIITLVETLEHIPPDDLPALVKSLHSCLPPEGVLLLTVPSKNFPVARKHYQHFDLPSLASALAPFFVISEHFYLNRISKWTNWLQCLLVNKLFILNQRRLLNRIYRWYEKHLLPANEQNARRICLLCRKSGRQPLTDGGRTK